MKTIELIKHFEAELFLPDLKGGTKAAVLEELIQPLVDGGMIKNQSILLETLSRRETLGSTAIGKGVAVPHCRTLAVSDVHVVVGLSKKGVDFQASDGKKVHLFFLIVAPPSDASHLYLPVLGKIVETVRDAKLRQTLLEIDTFSALVKILQGGTA
jgi:mannitol/fructose-specific phosphotransferase system IIA component (Ntr-type)